MHNFLLAIFVVSIILILHTYLFYPLGMILIYSKNSKPVAQYSSDSELPELAVLIAAYNEEKVIEEKILSVFNTTYPLSKIKVYVGSDASTDQTDDIIKSLQLKYNDLLLVEFPGRVGKIGIINRLQSIAKAELLILTDANVIFTKDTIKELIKNFKDPETGIVAANIIKESSDNEGISSTEKKYLSLENKIKTAESNAYKLIMGAEGGCYAIRNALFTKVPNNFIVDDFFITLSVLKQKKTALFNPASVCKEDVANDASGEYKRKVRISSGNFQNLFYFKRELFKFWTPLSFTFWSHKVLRWFTPLLLILCLVVSVLLIPFSFLFLPIFIIQLIGFLTPAFNHLLNFKNPTLMMVSHFYLMNFALLEGFMKYARGIRSSIWQPIKRNVL